MTTRCRETVGISAPVVKPPPACRANSPTSDVRPRGMPRHVLDCRVHLGPRRELGGADTHTHQGHESHCHDLEPQHQPDGLRGWRGDPAGNWGRRATNGWPGTGRGVGATQLGTRHRRGAAGPAHALAGGDRGAGGGTYGAFNSCGHGDPPIVVAPQYAVTERVFYMNGTPDRVRMEQLFDARRPGVLYPSQRAPLTFLIARTPRSDTTVRHAVDIHRTSVRMRLSWVHG